MAENYMDDSTAEFLDEQYEQTEAYVPAVPVKVRDVAYYTGLAVSAIGLVVVNSAAAVMEDPTAVVVIAGNVISAVGLVSSGLGVKFRPGKIQ